ncbi:MAG: hypothetical protein VKP62_11505 [Candidatus Sericytochromatia bacterium]|nr:hypothetical protein [Candidatus Sericytochromatia bacterium]
MRLSCLSAILVATAAALAPSPILAQTAQPARVGTAFYMGADRAIVIPFAGTPPRAFYYRISPTIHYFEFEGAKLAGAAVQGHSGVGALRRFVLTEKRANVVRITLETATPSSPAIQLKAVEMRFEIYPFAGAETPPSAAGGTPASRPPALIPMPVPPNQPAPDETLPPWFFLANPQMPPAAITPRRTPAPAFSPEPLLRPPVPPPSEEPEAFPSGLFSFASPAVPPLPVTPSVAAVPTAPPRRTPPPLPVATPLAATPTPEPFFWFFPGPSQTSAPTPLPTLTPTPQPTPTPTPLPTPTPTPLPTPSTFMFPSPVPVASLFPPLARPPVTPPSPATLTAPSPQVRRWLPPTPAPVLLQPIPPKRPPLPEPGPIETPLPVVRPPSQASRPGPLEPPRTRITAARYASDRHVLVLPYEGEAPNFEITALAPAELRVDLTRTILAGPAERGTKVGGDPVLVGWSVTPDAARGSSVVKLSLTGAGEVVVARDDVRREILLFPQLTAESASVTDGSVRTVLGPATFDEQVGGLAMDYRGEVPKYNITRLTRSLIYVDFPRAALNPTAVQFDQVTNSPLVSFWLFAPRPAREAVRAVLILPYGGQVQLLEDQVSGRILLVPRLGD